MKNQTTKTIALVIIAAVAVELTGCKNLCREGKEAECCAGGRPHSEPVVIRQPLDQIVKQGQHVEFEIEAGRDPQFYQWAYYPNDYSAPEEITNNPTANTRQLVIKEALPEDQGLYVCIVSRFDEFHDIQQTRSVPAELIVFPLGGLGQDPSTWPGNPSQSTGAPSACDVGTYKCYIKYLPGCSKSPNKFIPDPNSSTPGSGTAEIVGSYSDAWITYNDCNNVTPANCAGKGSVTFKVKPNSQFSFTVYFKTTKPPGNSVSIKLTGVVSPCN